MSPKALYQSESCHRKLKRSVIPAALLCGASSSTLRERPLCHPQCAAGNKCHSRRGVAPFPKERFFSVSPPHETSSRPKLKRPVIPGLAEEQLLLLSGASNSNLREWPFLCVDQSSQGKMQTVSMEKLVGCFPKGRKVGLSLSSTDGHSY